MALTAELAISHIVALVSGGLGGTLVGWFLHRSTERVTQEEHARGELMRLRYDAIAATLRAINELLTLRLPETLPPPQGEVLFQILGGPERIQKRAAEALMTITSNLLFLPLPLRIAARDMMQATFADNADMARMIAYGSALAKEAETYLPQLTRRDLAPDEFPEPAAPTSSAPGK